MIYDDDESHSLDDTELAKLRSDLSAGCDARNATLLASFDTDTSGVLEQAEWDAAKASLKAAHDAVQAAIDVDGDGTVTREEIQAAAEDFVATWDDDGDGTLSATERTAFRTAMQSLIRSGQPLPFIPPPPPPTTDG